MRLGVDLGGTKIEVVALGGDGGIALRRRCPTPAADGYDAIVRAVAGLVAAAESDLGISGATVGVGTPGAVVPSTGRLRNANTTCLNGRPLPQDLQAALGRPVRLANDANCLALSESADGAAAGSAVAFAAILGTGVGGGLVVGGSLVGGCNGVAGEWGHNPLPWPRDDERPGPPCYCGRAGCIETFLSGPAFARAHASCHGDTLDPVSIAQSAAAGDPAASDSMRRYAGRLARALASVINLVDPDVIVLGGGVSNVSALYALVPRLWDAWVFADAAVCTQLVRAAHGDSSGVLGAARLWDQADPA